MVHFIAYVIGTGVWCGIWVFIMEMLPIQPPNPLLLVCGGCKDKLYLRPTTKRWRFAESWFTLVVAWLVVFRLHPGLFLATTLYLMLAITLDIGLRRIVRHYWMWRHPLRCDGGGHFKPVPQGA